MATQGFTRRDVNIGALACGLVAALPRGVMAQTREQTAPVETKAGRLRGTADMSQAWINFARTGNPSREGLAWPVYDAATRHTMIFNVPSHVVSDPDVDIRKFFVG